MGFCQRGFYDTEREEEWLHCNILGRKQCGDSKMFRGEKEHTIPHLCFVCLQMKPGERSRCYCFGLSPNTPTFITSFSLHSHALAKMIICFLSLSAVDGIQWETEWQKSQPVLRHTCQTALRPHLCSLGEEEKRSLLTDFLFCLDKLNKQTRFAVVTELTE